MDYTNKLITTEQALALVKSGYKVAVGEGQGAPRGFLSKFHTLEDKVNNVELWTCRLPQGFPMLEMRNITFCTIHDTFITKPLRNAEFKNISYVPTHLSKLGATVSAQRVPDIFVTTCSLPKPNGMVSSGLSGGLAKELRQKSRIIIAEINENMPYTYGDTEFSLNDVDYVTEENIPLNPVILGKVSDRDREIGNLVAEYIDDGDCLQVGIGGIPDALMQCLKDKKDLGIHTELLGDGLIDLVEAGVVTNARKTLYKGKIVTSIVDGTQKAFDFVNDNKDVIVFDSSYTNDVAVLQQNDNQVSVNTTLEVDLTGQCCSESLGSRQYSGTGGQADTAIGAQRAKNGKSFIVLGSTANVLESGNVKMISKIVPQLKRGATVSLQRNDVQYIATEYGIVNLRGCSMKERALKLISIAHPGFRDWLTEEAEKLNLI
ncbi:MAG: acetyl-CoA hydrolase/transferase C-terminal domain-containing protein [Clostridia bacterium]